MCCIAGMIRLQFETRCFAKTLSKGDSALVDKTWREVVRSKLSWTYQFARKLDDKACGNDSGDTTGLRNA